MSKLYGDLNNSKTKAVLVAAEAAKLALALQAAAQLPQNKFAIFPFLATQAYSVGGWTAILRSIAKNASTLYGSNAIETAKIDDWLDNAQYNLYQSVSCIKSTSEGKAHPTKRQWEYHLQGLQSFFAAIQTSAKNQRYVAGKSFSIADIANVAMIADFLNLMFDQTWLAKYPQSGRYFKGLASEPAVSKYFTITECAKAFVPKFEEKKEQKKKDEKKQDKKKDDKKKEEKKKEDKKDEKKEEKKDEKKEDKKEEKKDKKQKKQQAKKKEAKKEQPKKKEDKKKKKEDDQEQQQEPEYAEKKKKNPLQDLPKSNFIMDNFKRQILNVPTEQRQKILQEQFWGKWEPEGWSIWKVEYQKYPGEGEKVYLTSNLKNGFLQRLDNFRKYTFAVHGVYGSEPNLEIRGVWFWRGVDIPQELKEHPSYEYHTFTRLNQQDPNHRKLLEDYWLNLQEGTNVDGLTVQDAKYFK